MYDPIPLAILNSIAHAVETIRAWNAALTRARAMEGAVHHPGRDAYALGDAYALRGTYAGKRLCERRDRALRTLDLFETRAQALGIPIEALYAACGGKPVLEPEGAAVWE